MFWLNLLAFKAKLKHWMYSCISGSLVKDYKSLVLDSLTFQGALSIAFCVLVKSFRKVHVYNLSSFEKRTLSGKQSSIPVRKGSRMDQKYPIKSFPFHCFAILLLLNICSIFPFVLHYSGSGWRKWNSISLRRQVVHLILFFSSV